MKKGYWISLYLEVKNDENLKKVTNRIIELGDKIKDSYTGYFLKKELMRVKRME